MSDIIVGEPTPEQCDKTEKVFESSDKIGHAIWYPQMGGYVGKAVAIFDREWSRDESTGAMNGGCVDVLVWHNGEFPFSGKAPAEIHHCDPVQFIEFGAALLKINLHGLKHAQTFQTD